MEILSGKFKKTPFFLKNIYIKPTSSFIKKKLFNWLGDFIINKSCLDLFSGLGTLGFECLSRGSKDVVLVEKNKNIFNFLINLKKKLNIHNVSIYNMLAADYIYKYKFKKFDIIFIDPPYKEFKNLYFLIKKCIFLSNINSLIYIESVLNISLLLNYFNSYFKILRKGVLGKINFFLFELI